MEKISCYLKQWKDVIYLSDDPDYLKERKKEGKAVILLLTKENRNADFSSFPYALELENIQEIELEDSLKTKFNEATDFGGCIFCIPEDLEDIMDTAFLERVMHRHKHLPITIMENERLRIRELSKEDGFAMTELFDKEGTGKYLDDFGWKPEEIATKLSEYIKTAYDISDYGIWAVCLKQTEELIGIISLQPRDIEDINGKADTDNTQMLLVKSKSLSLQNKEHRKQYPKDKENLNSDENSKESIRLFRSDDKDLLSQRKLLELGFALRSEYQKQGYGYEMCQLLLRYFEKDTISFIAYADSRNTASVMLLQKLGFREVKI